MENTIPNVPPVITTPAPDTTMPPPQSSVNTSFPSLPRRIGAWVIDFIFWFVIIGYIFALLTGNTVEGGYDVQGLPAVILYLIGFSYFVITETLWGATPGKSIMKIRVVKEDQTKISFKEAFIRNLARLVDMLPFLYIVGLIVISRSPNKQRLGDKWAHTLVVRK